jgi:hypothetical protein
MVSYLSHLTIDSHDPYAQSVWWSEVLGYAEDPDDPNEPGDEECMIFSAAGATRLLFIEVPDSKQDLRPADGSRDDELERLLGLGATEVDDRRLPDGRGWVVLADPEGNEFCILRSVAEMAAV